MLLDDYSLSMWGLFIILATVLVQSLVAALVKAAQPGAVPGKIDETLSHASFVFRSSRTVANSLENLPVMLGAAILALLVQADPFWVAVCIWTYALARLVHMILYYVISTEKNPSPRSHFYFIALLANVALLVFIALALI